MKPYKDENRLRELYVEKGLSIRDIASELDCSYSAVRKYLIKYDIERRDRWKRGLEKAQKQNLLKPPAFLTNNKGYEVIKSESGGTTYEVRHHRLLALLEHDTDEVGDNYVHHRNNIPWDNRPENIELMRPEDHGRLHANDSTEGYVK